MSTSFPAGRRLVAAAGALLAVGVLAIPAGASAGVPSVQWSDIAHAEGDAGTQTFTTHVHLLCTDGSATPLPAVATCQYDLGINKASTAAAAASPQDFLLTFDSNKTVTLNGGESRDVDLAVDVVGDTAIEPDETYNLGYSMTVDNPQSQLESSESGAGLAGTIVNDDKAAAPKPADTAPPKPATAVTVPGAPATVAAAPSTTAAVAPARPAATVDVAADEVGPRMGIVFSGLGTALKARVRCPRSEKSCTGRLAVRLNGTTLAASGFDLAGGASRVLRIELSRGQRRKLRRAGVVHLKATATDAAGNRVARELGFEL